MAISPNLARNVGSISSISAIQPLDVKDNTLLDLLLRERVVGTHVSPGLFATPTAPAAPSAPQAPSTAPTSNFTLPQLIELAHVVPGELISAASINALVDAILAVDKRLARIEVLSRQNAPSIMTAPPAPPPPVTATPTPPVAVNPNFTFAIANDLAHIELPAHEFEGVDEVKIGDLVIPKNEVAIDNGIARFTAPTRLFENVTSTPNISLTPTGGTARVLTGASRVIR